MGKAKPARPSSSPAKRPAGRPRKAWIIVAVSWDYNDEATWMGGEVPQTDLYYDRKAADAECKRLCDHFFSYETPEEFELDWDFYLGDRVSEPDFDPSKVTWQEACAAGFPEPFYVLELTVPGARKR